MPADNPPKRICITRVPYNYSWPGRSAVTVFRETGEYLVKAEVADHAVANGYAIPVPPRSQPRRKKAIAKADAGADSRSDAGVAGEGLAADDRAHVRGAMGEGAE